MVAGLVVGRLVQRSHWPIDGRSVFVSVTAKGTALLERLASEHAKEFLKQVALQNARRDHDAVSSKALATRRPLLSPAADSLFGNIGRDAAGQLLACAGWEQTGGLLDDRLNKLTLIYEARSLPVAPFRELAVSKFKNPGALADATRTTFNKVSSRTRCRKTAPTLAQFIYATAIASISTSHVSSKIPAMMTVSAGVRPPRTASLTARFSAVNARLDR